MRTSARLYKAWNWGLIKFPPKHCVLSDPDAQSEAEVDALRQIDDIPANAELDKEKCDI